MTCQTLFSKKKKRKKKKKKRNKCYSHILCPIGFLPKLKFCNSSSFYMYHAEFKPLKRQSQQLSSALSSAVYFKSHCCKQCGPRSDCSFRSSLIWVHTVCIYAKCKFEKFARTCSRRHKQTTFSDADFLGALRVKHFECRVKISADDILKYFSYFS